MDSVEWNAIDNMYNYEVRDWQMSNLDFPIDKPESKSQVPSPSPKREKGIWTLGCH